RGPCVSSGACGTPESVVGMNVPTLQMWDIRTRNASESLVCGPAGRASSRTDLRGRRGQAQDVDGTVVVWPGEVAAVWGKDELAKRGPLRPFADLLAAVRVPEDDAAVAVAGEQESAVGRQGQAVDRTGIEAVKGERLQLLAGQVPALHGPI